VNPERLFEVCDRVPLLRDLDGLAPVLRALPNADRKRLENAWRLGRRFARAHVSPIALSQEAAMHDDPRHVDPAFLEALGRSGLLSMGCFPSLGGLGVGATGGALVLEELCAGCAGLGNLLGAHQLGLAGVLLTRNLELSRRIQLEVIEGARRGTPVLLAAAVTEPQAGSDVEDARFLRTARICTTATRVPGGYALTGTKVFISNGSFARYVVVGAATDRKRPLETWTMFLVDATSEGFSVPRVEDKMGMKANPAAELHLQEVFVPDAQVLSDRVGDAMEATEVVLAASRGPVGAIATGTARGALERFLWFATDTRRAGRPPIDDPAIQDAVAGAVQELTACRATWIAATTAFDRLGFGALGRGAVTRLYGLPGAGLAVRLFSRSDARRQRLGELLQERYGGRTNDRVLAHASLAKRACSDVALAVVGRLMDLMGPAALEPEWGLEKAWRDVKLTQIYEGTNQLNRLCLYEKGVAP